MKKGWEYRKLENCLVKVPKQKELKTKDYKTFGQYPIVSQESTLISGYSDDIDKVFSHVKPVIIFGDHTKNVKYIDFDFVVGADGVKILMPQDDIISKFFYYVIKSFRLDNLGYARHYRLLKENIVPVPPLSEQQRIVSYLDSAFAKIDAVAKNAEATLNEAKALFQSALAKMMEPKEGWEEVTLDNICSIESTLVDPTDDNYNNLLHVGGANIESYTGRLINLMTAKDERLTSGKYLFDSNVVLYNKVRPYLVKVARPDFNGLCSADMYPLTPKKETTREFLYYLLIKKEFTNYAIKCSARAGMPKINRNSLFAYKASIPLNRKEQIRIVSTLDNIRKVLMHLESNLSLTLTECTALKQAILRQTFEQDGNII